MAEPIKGTYQPIVYCGNCRASQLNPVTNKLECWIEPPDVFVFKNPSSVSGYDVVSVRPETEKTKFCLCGQPRVDSGLVK